MNRLQHQFQEILALTVEHIKIDYDIKKSVLCSDTAFASFDILSSSNKKKLPHTQQTTVKHSPAKQTSQPLLQPQPIKRIIQTTKKQEILGKSPSQELTTTSAIEEPCTFSEELKKQIEKILPQLQIMKEIPSDEEAKILAKQWQQLCKQSEVLILNFSTTLLDYTFLINIKKAIESHFCSCSVIEVKEWEEKKEWSTFFKLHKPKLILGDPSLFSVKNLLPFYKENAVSKQMSLNTHPFMLLQPLADYLNHPEHKKSLWKNLCNSLRQP